MSIFRSLLPAYRRAKEFEKVTQLLPKDEAEIFKGFPDDQTYAESIGRFIHWKFVVDCKKIGMPLRNH